MKKQLCATGLMLTVLFMVIQTISVAESQTPGRTPTSGVVPAEGFVPDAKTAIKIAEAVIEPVYGVQTIRDERPFKARLVSGEWFVKGSSPTNADWKGGVVEVHISKTNGCVTFLFHGK